MIDRIFHIADVHIRNYKRHGEYRKVFDKTFKYIRENKTENSVIYLAGDIVHSKTDMSPEVISMCSYLFNECANICPTILITGNHDTNLNNNNRLDALTPVVDAIQNPNLHYFKETGVYELGGVTWAVYSVFGSPEDWPKPNEIKGDFKIALHHGAVTSAVTDMNYEIDNEFVTPSIFKGFDLALLGDIHRYQYLDSEKSVCYAGSLIQQNHGEGLNHGIVVWNIPEKTSKFVQIENEIGYYTINVVNGKITNDKSEFLNLPENLRLRLKYEKTSQSQLMQVLELVKSKYKILECVMEKVGGPAGLSTTEEVLGNVRDVEYQNQLITKYLEERLDIANINFDGVRHLNRTLNSNLFQNNKIVRNVIWKPLDFEFSNMFSYGENNKIDFTTKKGVQGIFAPNASGKSTLLDSLVFCLFDKSSRTYKGDEIINNRKDEFECKFRFQMAGDTFTIIRKGTQNKHGAVRVEVEFFKETPSGNRIVLNGEDRYKTNKIIREYIGSYDDFMLTTFSSQNDNKNFIFKSQRERQELLNSFLDNRIFEELYRAAREPLKEHKSNVKYLKNKLSEIDYPKLRTDLNNVKSEIAKLNDNILSISAEIVDIKKENVSIEGLINQIPPAMGIELIESSRKAINNKIHSYQESLQEIKNDLNHYTAEQIAFNDLAGEYDEIFHERLELEYQQNQANLSELINSAHRLKVKLENIESSIEDLHNHEYDPNCKYCIENSFVKKANQAKEDKPLVETELEKMQNEIKELQLTLKEQAEELENQEKMEAASKAIDDLQDKIEPLEDSKFSYEKIIQNSVKELGRLDDAEVEYKKYQNELEQNVRYRDEIQENENKIYDLQEAQSKIQDKLLDSKLKENTLKGLISNYEEIKEELKTEETQFQLFYAYTEAVSRNGVPYLLLSKVLPLIQTEVNEMLSRIVDFSVEFFSDENRNIECKINYSDDRHWPVELASGMEKFMISIATRVALVNITSLPRPNFIAIDEGFGVLDSENLASINLLFENLKSEFDFILCISHLEDMKDLADSLIFINKDEQGYSSVNS